MKLRELVQILELNGWKSGKRKATSHIVFKKTGCKNNISVSKHGHNSEIPLGTYKKIFRTAGIEGY